MQNRKDIVGLPLEVDLINVILQILTELAISNQVMDGMVIQRFVNCDSTVQFPTLNWFLPLYTSYNMLLEASSHYRVSGSEIQLYILSGWMRMDIGYAEG